MSISGQDPEWFLSVYNKDKIELLNPIWVVEVMICRKVQISNDLISSAVVCRS